MSEYDRGLTQIAPATAVAYTSWRGHPDDLYNPETNLRVIIEFLRNRGFNDETDTGLNGAIVANIIVNTNSRTGTPVEGHLERAEGYYNLLDKLVLSDTQKIKLDCKKTNSVTCIIELKMQVSRKSLENDLQTIFQNSEYELFSYDESTGHLEVHFPNSDNPYEIKKLIDLIALKYSRSKENVNYWLSILKEAEEPCNMCVFAAEALVLIDTDVKKIAVKRKNSVLTLLHSDTNEKITSDLEEELKDEDLNLEYGQIFFPELFKLYSDSPENQRFIYEKFIKLLLPSVSGEKLDYILTLYSNAYARYKNEQEYKNPERLKTITDEDFSSRLYVRFEDEQETSWPKEGQIGFLPFDTAKVNPARGNLFSIIEYEALVREGFLLSNGNLNGDWSSQKRQDFLRNRYGIDVGSRKRTMIFFNIENSANLRDYENYVNVAVCGKVPIVKVIKKS